MIIINVVIYVCILCSLLDSIEKKVKNKIKKVSIVRDQCHFNQSDCFEMYEIILFKPLSFRQFGL